MHCASSPITCRWVPTNGSEISGSHAAYSCPSKLWKKGEVSNTPSLGRYPSSHQCSKRGWRKSVTASALMTQNMMGYNYSQWINHHGMFDSWDMTRMGFVMNYWDFMGISWDLPNQLDIIFWLWKFIGTALNPLLHHVFETRAFLSDTAIYIYIAVSKNRGTPKSSSKSL